MKSRVKGCSIEIEAPKDPQKKLRMFENIFVTNITKFDEECDQKFLMDLMDSTKDFNGRDYAALAVESRGQFRDEFSKPKIIKIEKRHLLNAVKEIRKVEQDFKYEEDDISEEELRHRENIGLQKKNHKESIDLQKKHFVQSQKAQVEMVQSTETLNVGIGSFTRQRPTESSKNKILGGFTEEQQFISDGLDEEAKRVRSKKKRQDREERPNFLNWAFNRAESFSQNTLRLALHQFQSPSTPSLEGSPSQLEQSIPSEQEEQ